ncbi:transcription termination factor MTERF15, mitochondrial-like [Cryptomeria japonica]|uniref:transcription termination factor MTERF15, mitochondrial-like n=1 Tax=Cryptomeria japonica TaxID=3369 RepID=UPI0027D9DA5E|nr:transcription termination factor MTERF15, mitochondrial-like [Cryptomeria japonica]
MGSKLFSCLPVRRNLFLKTLTHFCFNFSTLSEGNASNSNAPSQNLFLYFVTTRFNMSSADVAKMLKLNPTLGRLKTLDKVEQLVNMLNRHGCAEDQIANIIRTQPSLMTTSVERLLEPNIQVLKDLGLERENITKIVTSSLTPEQLDLIRKIGIQKESKMYKYVVSVVAKSRIEVLKAKINNLQLCGFSPEEALEVVRFYPSVLEISEEHVQKKMEFMFNHMGLSVDFVTKHARMFTMSLDKVMRPRFSVLRSMTAMNRAGEVKQTRIYSALKIKEAKFVAQIIEGHPESAALWTVYKNAIANVSESSKTQR